MKLHLALRVALAMVALVVGSTVSGTFAQASVAAAPGAVAAATCTSSIGPGIPPPASVPSGIPGFHAAWYGQSGYMTLCPGDTATATVAMYNSGSYGWVNGVMGQVAYLGTWNPSPGQDQPSVFGGDGTNGSPNTGWPRYNRVAIQPASYVGPNQVAWFQFGVRAPLTPGTYGFNIRPLIEGAQWMEDYGIYWVITVPAVSPDTTPPSVSGASTSNAGTVNVAFSKPMRCPTDGSLTSIATGTNYTIATFPGGTVVPETVSVSTGAGCTQATLTLSSPLTLGGQYQLTVNNVQDSSGNSISSSGRTATFTAVDTSGAPSAGAQVTGANQVTVTYSKPMDTATTGTLASYRLDSVSCAVICSSVTTTSRTAVLNFAVPPASGAHVLDIANVKDTAGTAISPNPTSLTLAFPSSTTRPTVTNVAASGSSRIVVSFSTNMDPASAQTTANYSLQNASGITYTSVSSATCDPSTSSCASVNLVPAAALTTGSYNVVVANLRDTYGNVINPNPTSRAFSFTADTTPPTVAAMSGSQTALGSAMLSVTYGKAMKSSIPCGQNGTPSGGTGAGIDSKGDYTVTSGPDGSAMNTALQGSSSAFVSADCRSITFTIAGNFTAGTYGIQVAGAQDQSSNTIVTSTTNLTFTDAVAPTIASVSLDSANQITVTFSKRMTGGSTGASSAGNSANYQVNNLGYANLCAGSTIPVITATSSALTSFQITCATGGAWGAAGTNVLTTKDAADYNGNVIAPNPSSKPF